MKFNNTFRQFRGNKVVDYEPPHLKIARRSQKKDIDEKERASHISHLLFNLISPYPSPHEIRQWSPLDIDLVEDWAIRTNETPEYKNLMPGKLVSWIESKS